MAGEHPSSPPGWKPVPAHPLPEPTLWPASLSLAATFFLWGLVASGIITAIGAILFAISIGGWIQDIRHERKTLL